MANREGVAVNWKTKRLYYATKKHIAQYDQWTKDLQGRVCDDEPFHSRAHCIEPIMLALELTKSGSVFEVGFNLGHGSAIFLGLGVKYVASCDPSQRPGTIANAHKLMGMYPDQFKFINSAFSYVKKEVVGKHDLVFIDGSHEFGDVDRDIKYARECHALWLLLDDWDEHFGEGVQAAVRENNLKPIAILGNMALCRPLGEYEYVGDQ